MKDWQWRRMRLDDEAGWMNGVLVDKDAQQMKQTAGDGDAVGVKDDR